MSYNFNVREVADLARISVSDSEISEFQEGFASILSYIDEIRTADIDVSKLHIEKPHIRNVTRNDDDAYDSGIYKEKLLSQAPSRVDDYVRVKKMISQDN